MNFRSLFPGRKIKELESKVQALEAKSIGALSFEKTVSADGTVSYLYGFSIPSYSQDTTTQIGQMTAYDLCSPISGIISRKARAFNNGAWDILDNNDDQGKGSYYNYVTSLLNKPNCLQTRRQWEAQAYTYLQLFGECFIYGLTPTGSIPSRTDRIKALWVVPNWMIQPEYTGKQFKQTEQSGILLGYRMNNGTESIGELIPPELILHIKDINIDTGLGWNSHLLSGSSRLVPLQAEVSNIIASYEARGQLISNRGAIGVLSPTTTDVTRAALTPDEKKKLSEEYQAAYGVTGGKRGLYIASEAMNWNSMIAPTKELMLFEEIEDDVRSLCFAYGFPQPLLGFAKGTTYSNMNEAKKDLYQDAIIPESVDFSQCLTNWNTLGISREGFHLDIDYTHLDILQQSAKDKADALRSEVTAFNMAYQSGVITQEEVRSYFADKFGIDAVTFNGSTFYTGQPSAINITDNGK